MHKHVLTMAEVVLPYAHLLQHELVAITGYRQKAKQRSWLKSNKVPFKPNAFGHPIVSRAHWERANNSSKSSRNSCPNWGAPGELTA